MGEGAGSQCPDRRFPYVAEVVAADPALRGDLKRARSLGVSLRRYLGWEPTTTTRTGPDGTTITRRTEPEFDDWERALWAALDAYEAGCCPDCGIPHAEGLFDADKPLGDRVAWQVGMAQCEPCKAIETAQHAHTEQLRKRHRDAWFPTRFMKWFPIRPKEVPHG